MGFGGAATIEPGLKPSRTVVNRRGSLKWIVGGTSAVVLLVAAGAWFVPGLIATSRVVSNYSRMLTASFVGDLNVVQTLCSRRYLAAHPLKSAPEGGIVGMPRGIHKNFKVWVEGKDVWLCPTNRIGAVYRFVREEGDWKFDGPVGLLRAGGELVRLADGADLDEDAAP